MELLAIVNFFSSPFCALVLMLDGFSFLLILLIFFWLHCGRLHTQKSGVGIAHSRYNEPKFKHLIGHQKFHSIYHNLGWPGWLCAPDYAGAVAGWQGGRVALDGPLSAPVGLPRPCRLLELYVQKALTLFLLF